MATVWIIGASSGIGRSLALAYAQLGYQVFASARSQSPLQALSEEFEAQNAHTEAAGEILALPMDMTDVSTIESAVGQIAKRTNTLDKVIINGGTCEYVDELPLDIDLFQRVFNTNLFGVINCINGALPLLETSQDKDTQLVLVSSSVTYQSLPRAHAYGGSKAALRYLAECLKVDLLNSGIDVRLVSPGFVKTPLTDKNDFDMPFLISSDDAAQRIVKGLNGSSFDIQFPKRFTYLLKLFSYLPQSWKFKLLAKSARPTERMQKSQ